MPIKLNQRAYDHAKWLIKNGCHVRDGRGDWSEHQPSSEVENRFIEQRGIAEYARWHLGLDTSHSRDAKAQYKFPYGDLVRVHLCAVLAAEARAGQYKYFQIALAAAHLHGMLENRS